MPLCPERQRKGATLHRMENVTRVRVALFTETFTNRLESAASGSTAHCMCQTTHATEGDPTQIPPEYARKNDPLIESRGRTRQKPESVRGLVEKVGPGARLALFGRRAVPGWTVCGDQAEVDLLCLTA